MHECCKASNVLSVNWLTFFKLGGYDSIMPATSLSAFIYFAVTYKWRVLPLPSPSDDQYEQAPYHRYGHTAVAYADRAYIFGGRNDKNGACNILFCFDAGNIFSFSHPRVVGFAVVIR